MTIANRVKASLFVMVVVMILLTVCTTSVVFDIRKDIESITKSNIPFLLKTITLVQESEQILTIVPEIIAAPNSYVRSALAQEFRDRTSAWESQVKNIQGFWKESSQLEKIVTLLRYLHSNIDEMTGLLDARGRVDERLYQIGCRIERLGGKIQTNTSSAGPNFEIMRRANVLTLCLLAGASATGEPRRDEFWQKAKKNIGQTESLFSQIKTGEGEELKKIYKELVRFATGERNVFFLSRKQQRLSGDIADLLILNVFVSRQMKTTTEQSIQDLSSTINELLDYSSSRSRFANTLSLILLVIGFVFTGMILLHLRRSVVARLLTLEEAIRNHVSGAGSKAVIPVSGNDEITAIARATKFFISEINQREQALLLSHEKLEQRVEDRTQELAKKNQWLWKEIAERKTFEAALRESEMLFRLLADNLKEALCFIDVETLLINYTNRAFKESLMGKEGGSFHSATLIRLLHPEDRSGFLLQLRELWGKDELESGEFEVRLLWDSRPLSWGILTFIYIRNERGEKLRVVMMFEDITERKRAESKISNSESRLKYLSTRILEAQEEERRRLAAELHDNIGPTLAAVKFGVENVMGDVSAQQRDTLTTVIGMVKGTVVLIREIQKELRPSLIDDLGLLEALEWHCHEYTNIYRSISVTLDLQVEEEIFPLSLKIVIYRIVQESLNNIAKHSGANQVTISLLKEGHLLKLFIEDNGSGIGEQILDRAETALSHSGKNRQRCGLGLISMRERVELSTGLFKIESSFRGTRITCCWDCLIVEKLED